MIGGGHAFALPMLRLMGSASTTSGVGWGVIGFGGSVPSTTSFAFSGDGLTLLLPSRSFDGDALLGTLEPAAAAVAGARHPASMPKADAALLAGLVASSRPGDGCGTWCLLGIPAAALRGSSGVSVTVSCACELRFAVTLRLLRVSRSLWAPRLLPPSAGTAPRNFSRPRGAESGLSCWPCGVEDLGGGGVAAGLVRQPCALARDCACRFRERPQQRQARAAGCSAQGNRDSAGRAPASRPGCPVRPAGTA